MPEWLLISYHVPSNPSALRVAAWRALRQRGALLLGDGLYALPNSKAHRAAVETLASRIVEGGGTATTFVATTLSPAEEDGLLARFVAARAAEYRQVTKSATKLVDHISREDESSDYRFAEVESLEEELGKVRRQFELVEARSDSGSTEERAAALEAIAAAEERLRRYLDHAYEGQDE